MADGADDGEDEPAVGKKHGRAGALGGEKGRKLKRAGTDGHLAHVGRATGFRPVLLAKKWDGRSDPTGWWMSEKLDGVRAYWDGQRFYSRLKNIYNAPKWYTKDFPDHPIDGELWVGRSQFQKAVSIVKKKEPHDGWKEIKYLVFDLPSHHGPFEARLEAMKRLKSKYITVVEHKKCRSIDHLHEELARVEALGGEGLMLRQPGSHYVGARSETLLKVKTFNEGDAKVIGHEPGKGRHTGRMGALLCEMIPGGARFKIGTGFSDAQRARPPKIGTIVNFKYQELGVHGNPRFPVFVGERAD